MELANEMDKVDKSSVGSWRIYLIFRACSHKPPPYYCRRLQLARDKILTTKTHQAVDIHYGGNATTSITTGTFANNNFTSPLHLTTAYPVYTSGTTDPPSMFSTMAGTRDNLEGGG